MGADGQHQAWHLQEHQVHPQQHPDDVTAHWSRGKSGWRLPAGRQRSRGLSLIAVGLGQGLLQATGVMPFEEARLGERRGGGKLNQGGWGQQSEISIGQT